MPDFFNHLVHINLPLSYNRLQVRVQIHPMDKTKSYFFSLTIFDNP